MAVGTAARAKEGGECRKSIVSILYFMLAFFSILPIPVLLAYPYAAVQLQVPSYPLKKSISGVVCVCSLSAAKLPKERILYQHPSHRFAYVCSHAVALPQTPSHRKRPRRKGKVARQAPLAPSLQNDDENQVSTNKQTSPLFAT